VAAVAVVYVVVAAAVML